MAGAWYSVASQMCMGSLGGVLLYVAFMMPLVISPHSPHAADGDTDKELLIYQKLFQQRRSEQITAIKSIIAMNDYTKQHKMVSLLMDKLFEIMSQSRVKAMESDFIPGQSKLPENTSLRSDISNILENVLFFGEILLRLPDVSHKVYDSKKEWKEIINWSITFANETNFLDKVSEQVLYLMTQELNLVDRDPDYVNPYKADARRIKDAVDRLNQEERSSEAAERKRKEKRERRKEKKKGPRLSEPRHNEL